MYGNALVATLPIFLAACSALLPKEAAVTQSPWESYQDAEQTFEKVVPYQTTVEDLKQLQLDPNLNSNVSVLSYSDIVRRFIPSASLNALGVDHAVQECLQANSACKGYELNHRVLKRNRYGSFLADFLNFHRKVDVVGWRFNAVILIKNNVVVYKLTGGQPAIHEHEEAVNPLGPLQGAGESASLPPSQAEGQFGQEYSAASPSQASDNHQMPLGPFKPR